MKLHPSRGVRISLDESYLLVIRIFDNIWKIHENIAVICRQWFNKMCWISTTSGALSSFSISMCTWNNHDFIFWQKYRIRTIFGCYYNVFIVTISPIHIQINWPVPKISFLFKKRLFHIQSSGCIEHALPQSNFQLRRIKFFNCRFNLFAKKKRENNQVVSHVQPCQRLTRKLSPCSNAQRTNEWHGKCNNLRQQERYTEAMPLKISIATKQKLNSLIE